MIQLLVFIIIGIALLLIVGALLWDTLRGRRPRRSGDLPACPEPAYLPSRALMDRIFAEEDLAFVSGEGARAIRRLFLKDRRRMALSWLRQTRREATRILQLHLHTVRTDLSLQPLTEIKLAFHALLFFAIYGVLFAMIGLFGAFRPRSAVRDVVALANGLSALGGNILAEAGRSPMGPAESHGHA